MPTTWTRLAEDMFFVQGDLTRPEVYKDVAHVLEEAAQARGTGGNVLFYLAVADPLFYGTSRRPPARAGEPAPDHLLWRTQHPLRPLA